MIAATIRAPGGVSGRHGRSLPVARAAV
jgi:hypothetical protein